MNDSGNRPTPTTPATPAARAGIPPHVAAGDDHGQGWPVCRCGHPMHPSRLETRRGIPMERFECPRHRWWNAWRHPVVWETPRE